MRSKTTAALGGVGAAQRLVKEKNAELHGLS